MDEEIKFFEKIKKFWNWEILGGYFKYIEKVEFRSHSNKKGNWNSSSCRIVCCWGQKSLHVQKH